MVVMAPGGRRAEADVLAEAVVLVGCEGRVEPSINHKVGSTVQPNTNNQPAKRTRSPALCPARTRRARR